MTVDVDALFAAIDEDPDDEGRYLVLADALTAIGDPHGELIVLQHALARTPYDRELSRAEQSARRAAWPELTRHRAAIRQATWRLGFVDAIDLDGGDSAVAAVGALRAAASTRHVRTIRSSGTLDVDAGVLAELPNLRELVVDIGFKTSRLHAVAALPRLESLGIGIGLDSVAPTTIESMPGALRSFAIRDSRNFGDDHVAATARMSTLRRLSLRGLDAITDTSASRLGEGIRELDVTGCTRITSGILQHLADRPLAGLRIGLKDAALDGNELGRLHGSLERLEAYSLADAEPALAAAARQPHLRELEIACYENAPVTAESVARALALPALRRFELRCDGAMTGSVAALSSHVEHVELRVAGHVPALIESFASLPLRVLDLGRILWANPHVDDAIVTALAPSSRLATLSLHNATITDAGLRHLHAMTALETLDLGNCRYLTSRGVVELACALPALRALDLDQTAHQTGIDSLAGLEHHPTLAKLDLQNTLIGRGDVAIAATLPNLTSLRLSGTSIRDADLVALLPAAATLRSLDINQCSITAAAIDVLRQLQALEYLDLLNSLIDKASFAQLRAALPACRIIGDGWDPSDYEISDPFEK